MIDITKWQHDLFRPNLRPYNPAEIELIRRYSELADAENSTILSGNGEGK